MTSPSPTAFAALARSSPWRWSTLRFTVRWDDPWRTGPARSGPLRAWLRRPDALRVETTDGVLIQVVHQRPQRIGVMTTDGGYSRTLPWPDAPDAPMPRFGADGLVAERPRDLTLSYDAPMYQDYRWVAMLDPVELADGRDPDTGLTPPGVTVDAVSEVEHGGRPAWEAVLETTPVYEPRCACCPLLRDRRLDVLEFGAEHQAVREPGDYPTGHRVRLDVGTGVCVLTEEIGGARPGSGHDLRIEAVDEPMPDDLFVEPPRRRTRRGWAPVPGRQQVQ